MWSSAGLFNIAVTETTAATVAAQFCLCLGSWLPCFGGCRERCGVNGIKDSGKRLEEANEALEFLFSPCF